MSNWHLLIIGGSAHLVDLDSKIIDIAGFGRFPSDAVSSQKIGSEFNLLGEKCLIARYALSDIQSNLKRGPQIVLPKDIAWMVYKSGLAAGDTVVEAGCGSAALTLALAAAIARDSELVDKTEKIEADAIVLDLPNPNELVEWAKRSLRLGGFLLSYVPTVQQVQNFLVSLKGWKEIEVVEIIQRNWQTKSNALRPKTNMLGHTGFIISARWNG